MRHILCGLAAIILVPFTAAGEPVSLQQAKTELSKRGAKAIQSALFSGSPVIQANLENQGMTMRMTQCEGEGFECKTATFNSCREYPDFTRAQALEVTNGYSSQNDARGAAHIADDPVSGQKFCVRLRIDLHEEDRFDISDVFDWQLTMRDFFAYTDAANDRNISRRLLGQ